MIERLNERWIELKNLTYEYRVELKQLTISSLIILFVLLSNEVILRYYIGMNAFNIDVRHLIPYLLIPVGLLLIGSRMVLFSALVLITITQIIWFGTFRYFGNVIGPDIILLGTTQAFEIGLAAKGEMQVFIFPLILGIALNIIFGIFLYYYFHSKSQRFKQNTQLGVLLLALPFIIVSVRSAVHSRPFVLNPSPFMPSHTGVVQAVSLAVRAALTDSQYNDLGAPKLVIGAKLPLQTREPITVAVIMGESISPQELGIYGAAKATTPLMTKRFSTSGPLSYVQKLGFSAGTATLASVPLFIRMAYNPVAAYRRQTTIFEIAQKQGFATGFYSAQNIKPLQIAGGLSFLDKVETRENWQALYEEKRDGIILDQMKASPVKGRNQFYFLHQRANHGPYYCKDEDKVSDRAELRAKARRGQDWKWRTDTLMKRINRYHTGLLCYDKSLDELLSKLAKRPGELYIFISADHSEIMGDDGIWGHANLDLRATLVPMILATNRPNSDIAKRFTQLELPTSFQFMQLVARALGRDIHLAKPVQKFFINGMIAYGRRGYIEATKTDKRDQFRTSVILPNNQRTPVKTETLTGLGEMLDYIKTHKPVGQETGVN